MSSSERYLLNEKVVCAVALVVALCVAAFAYAGRVVGSGPDVFGGYTTEHFLVSFDKLMTPRGMIGALGVTGVGSLDRLGAKWRVSAIQPVSPDGYANVRLADELGISRTYKFEVPRGTDVQRMIADYSKNSSVQFAEVDGIGSFKF
jgi:hypothetical protein